MDDSVSEFIVRTCQMLPKSNTNVFNSIHLQAYIYLFFCGSIPEFFIQPLHSCIDDIDIFKMITHSLAFTDEKPVLPYDFHHIAKTIDCLLIEPYLRYPAFVRLRLFGQMRYNRERKSFEFIQADDQRIITTTEIDEFDIIYEIDKRFRKVGPACRLVKSLSDDDPQSRKLLTGSFSSDYIASIWCPHWPNEAKNWPFRRRKYGWPTTATIHEVVQTGCHVVPAKHPACRNDMQQFRLSFSFAEVILLQSWTPVQQIVYHLIRFFAKREIINKDCSKEDEVLCTYHFKTLMLWSCEKMSSEWWHSSSVIGLCRNLLEKLVQLLKEKRCPNYFIPMSNLFHEHFNRKVVDETAKKLIYYCDSENLSHWFVEHYVQSRFLDVYDANDTPGIVSYVYEQMLNTCAAMNADKPKAIDSYVSFRFWCDVEVAHKIAKHGLKNAFFDCGRYCLRINSVFEDAFGCRPFAEIESCYWLYGSMLRMLHAAYLLESKEIQYESEWFVDEIRQVLVRSNIIGHKYRNLPRPLNSGVIKSQLYFIRAHDLMENLTGSNDDLEFQVRSEISKGLLGKAFSYEDSKRNSIGRATLAYMAALHFAASEYQIAIDLCSRVHLDQKSEKEDSETLNAGCLLYIEDITKIIGFYLLFRKTRDTSLHYTRRPFFVDLRLTPEVFADYLKISSVERTVMAFRPYNISQTPTFALDAILITTTNRRCSQISKKRKNISCVYQRTEPMNKFEAPIESPLPNDDNITELLMEYSLGNMRSFYNAMGKDFGIHCNTADCYRAAYLYQCRRYPEVLDLCERILDEPDVALKELAFANIMVLPPIDSYFDVEVRCLLGFHTLFYYLSSLYDNLPKTEGTSNWALNQFFVQSIHSWKCLLSKVLDVDNIMIRHYYFLGRHFLARYLKVRCLIDQCNSLSQAMLEFNKLKASLPFEHIIRCFLKQTLGQLQKSVIAIAKY